MGDVVSITDTNDTELVQYEYDPWGKCIVAFPMQNDDSVTKLADLNPIRYRGYYFDSETGYYYLQSRYYDPDICRFINADLPQLAKAQKNIAIGINVFAYCSNNPINISDITGKGPVQSILSVIGDSISTVEAIIEFIANSCSANIRSLESKAKMFTKAKKQTALLKDVVSQSNKLAKRLGTIGRIVTGFAILTGVIEAIRSGASFTFIVVKAVVDAVCSFLTSCISTICQRLVQKIPAVGFIVSIAVATATSIALDHYFSDSRINSIANKVLPIVKKKSIRTVKALLSVVLTKIAA